MELVLRQGPYGWSVDPDSKEKTPLCYEVQDVHLGGRTVAWISNWAGSEKWHIQRFEDGIPGKETGEYDSAAEALTVLKSQSHS
jgi:hypothetical protein